jgi:hypothetical protein
VIYGLDFTSAPSRQKPIVCVASELTQGVLRVSQLIKIASLNEFEVFLKRRGPWIAGFDFPFGQPRKLIVNLGWPQAWELYVEKIAQMSQQEFETMLERYRQPREAGDKHHLRVTDAKAESRSPMMLHGVPVGKMFLRGAPRLLRSEVSILPCRPTHDDRVAIEAYPALVARKWIGKRSYKSDDTKKQTSEQEAARRDLIRAIRSAQLEVHYGFRVEMDEDQTHSFIQDPTGDTLDALLCAIQAAWAYSQRERGYGIPADCDLSEGWIVDPEMI